MNRIKLNVLGISYSQTQSGAYALVLTEEEGERRIPIIVGGFEAQSIAIQLEGLNPPRPLTHDLFVSFSKAFHIALIEVTIYKLEEGVFFSKLTCDDGKKEITIDARTSDAIALALRFKCPIYTTEDIMQRAGIVLDFEKESQKPAFQSNPFQDDFEEKTPGSPANETLKDLDISQLKEQLKEAVTKEDYEKASIIRDELKRRSNN